MAALKEGFGVLKKTFSEFSEDDCSRMAAALAYYTVFSLPPLLVLIILLAGAVFGQEAIQGEIQAQIGSLIGPEAAGQVQTMIQNASAKLSGSGGLVATLLSVAALLFGATGAFTQLQDALNRAWEVEPDPQAGGLKSVLFKRVLSFGMILGVAFLLLVSLVVSAAISVVLQHAQGLLPEGVSGAFLWFVNLAVTFGIITLLFAAMFKILPDADIGWRDVWPGAAFTALLFTLGKFFLSFYLGRSDPGSAFGAAGSLALILVWIYYSSMIVFLGAEFTQVWMQQKGRDIVPSKGAVRVVKYKEHVRGQAAARGAGKATTPAAQEAERRGPVAPARPGEAGRPTRHGRAGSWGRGE